MTLDLNIIRRIVSDFLNISFSFIATCVVIILDYAIALKIQYA